MKSKTLPQRKVEKSFVRAFDKKIVCLHKRKK